MHDFVRDSVRAALMKARPVPQFTTEIDAHPTASPSLTPGFHSDGSRSGPADSAAWRIVNAPTEAGFTLQAPVPPPVSERFHFGVEGIAVDGNAALSLRSRAANRS